MDGSRGPESGGMMHWASWCWMLAVGFISPAHGTGAAAELVTAEQPARLCRVRSQSRRWQKGQSSLQAVPAAAECLQLLRKRFPCLRHGASQELLWSRTEEEPSYHVAVVT